MTNAFAHLDSLSDLTLLQAHCAGDPDAFEVFVHRYQRPLFGFLVRFTANDALAEDIFQDTFVKVHRAAASLDQRGNIKSWLFTVAANTARDALRRLAVRRAASLDAPREDSPSRQTSLADLLVGKNPLPDEISVNRETRQAVVETVGEMDPRLREVLALSYLSELKQTDIAGILDIPLGTVKSRLHQALRDFAGRWARRGNCKHD